jgi:glycosyltransferase involved in cell wall biosynthesis
LTEAGIEVGLWAPDQSAAITPLLPTQSPVQRLTGSASEALDSFGPPDVLHDNGMWLRHNHRLAQLAAKRGIPRIVSMRGMLEPWAINHKRLKKRLAWSLYQQRDLKQARCHHTTAEAEAANVRRLGLGVPVRVIPNGVEVPRLDGNTRSAHSGKQRTALFLGRIYPVKGLPMLVEAWARVRPAGWRLQIAGPDEAGHRAEIERVASAAGLNEIISFLGPLDGEAKQSALLSADLFVLPTHSESFGVVVGEALGWGLPVLTTTAAPWPMLLERGCGWRVDPTVDGLADGLRQATALDSKTLHAMGAKGRELVEAEFRWDHVAKQFAMLYNDLVR